MKLLKSSGCSFPGDGGNAKERTTLVEVQGIGFWTRVRLPSSPSKKSDGDIYCEDSISVRFLSIRGKKAISACQYPESVLGGSGDVHIFFIEAVYSKNKIRCTGKKQVSGRQGGTYGKSENIDCR